MADPRPPTAPKASASYTDGLIPYVDRLIANYYAFMAALPEQQARPATRNEGTR